MDVLRLKPAENAVSPADVNIGLINVSPVDVSAELINVSRADVDVKYY